ncbi:hypothetical protein OAH43_00440 [bacterium]|nr:hypothetical protein [bacterium]
MSIEDVDYMKQNSIKENYTFIVDSKFRNQEEYPNPNNYVVNFDIPFKNVFGIEILDVSVPKTMYNIDNDTNKLYIYINTTKNAIMNYFDMAEGLEWEKFDNIRNIQEDSEIINYILSDNLKNNTIIDSINNYGITNLNKYNYISVVDILNWNRIVIDVNTIDNDSNYTSIYNIKLSEDLKINNIFQNPDQLNEYDINNLRTYNVIPIIDSEYDEKYYLKWYNIGTEQIENNYGLKWEYIGNTKPIHGNNINNDFLINNIINNELELSFEKFESLNIDISNKNNYIEIINDNIKNYYKPKTNINVGNKWTNIDIESNYYQEYENNNLGNEIKNKIYNNEELIFTNEKLNDLNFDYNNDINIFIKIITGLKWRITNSINDSGENLIDNSEIIRLIRDKSKNITDIIDFEISDFTIFDKNFFITNINSNSYILIDNIIWRTEYTTYVPDGTVDINGNIKKEWLINNNLVNLIKNTDNYEQKYNQIIINEIEWNNLNIENDELLSNTIIIVDNYYYKILPSYHYISNIHYYYAKDILNVNSINDYQKLLDLFFELFIIEIPIGNYTLNKLIVKLNTKFRENINSVILNRKIEDVNKNTILIDIDNFELELQCSGNTIPADIQNILKFEGNRHIIFDMNKSTLNKTLGFYSKVSDNLEFINNYSYLNINKINTYEKFYHSIKIIDSNKNRIIAPGIVYLIGSEYIILKCPEIEEHLYGSLSYTKNTIGLAKIRVTNWGLNEESTSYLKLKLREFHPIGKLSKITLQFENAEGNLYDFRGVNHNIVFAVHYYSAKQKQNFEKSIINPEYKMNFMDYKYSQEEKEEESDIEDDENNSLINIEEYKKMEQKYSDKKFENGYELDYNKIRKNLYDNINDDSENE